MTTTSRSFFLTVRPAEGYVVTQAHDDFVLWLRKNSSAYVCAHEKSGYQLHMHSVFITSDLKRLSSVKRSVKTLFDKYYNPTKIQLKLKVAMTPEVEAYVRKDGNIIDELEPHKIFSMISDDSVRSLAVVEENSEFKNTRIKWAYDNKDTWKAYFKSLDCYPKLDDWLDVIVYMGGRIPPSRFAAITYFNYHLRKPNIDKESRKRYRDAATLLDSKQPCKKSKVSQETPDEETLYEANHDF